MATTWNSLDKDAGITLSNGNLTATGSSGQPDRTVRATTAITTGQKRYWETQFTTLGGGPDDGIGFALASCPLNTWIGNGTANNSVGNFKADTAVYGFTVIGTVSVAWALNDWVGCAVDFDGKLVWYRINGVWNAGGTANPATGVGGFTFSCVGDVFPAITFGNNTGTGVATANFGATPLNAAVPAGFSSFDDFLMPQVVM